MSSSNSTSIPNDSDTSVTVTSTSTTSTILSTTTEVTSTSKSTSTTSSELESTSTSSTEPTSPSTTSTNQQVPTTTTASEVETVTKSQSKSTQTTVVTITRTELPATSLNSQTETSTSTSPTSSSTGTTGGISISGGLEGGPLIAVAVIVPVVIIAVVAVVLVFYFKKRKNPDASAKGGVAGIAGGAPPPGDREDGVYEMNDTGAGYRGWGSTAGGRKAPMASGGGTGYPMPNIGKAVSDAGYSNNGGYVNSEQYNSPSVPASPLYPDTVGSTHVPLLGVDRAAPSPAFTEGSTIGAMPTFDSNNGGGLNRGASNASSNYSGMTHSDQSDYEHRQSLPYYGGDPQDHDAAYFSSGPNYYDDSSNPPPVIRDVQARRNTRIETPTSSHFPQQGSSGIAQNF